MAPNGPDGKVTDPRFSSVHNDPRFVRPKKRDQKVGIDKRFKQMLSDKDFSTNAKVDRYGRKLDGRKGTKEIDKLYELEVSDQDSSSESDDNAVAKVSKKPIEQTADFTAFDEEDDSEDKSSDEDQSDDDAEAITKYDPARGEGNISSSDDEDELPEDLPIDGRDLIDPEPDRENIPQGEVTSRFAVVNLDWDNLHAEDLFVTMNSFKSALGSVERVSIYPSQFGKERMAREDTSGPPQNIFGADEVDDDRPINAKTIVKESLGEEFDMAKLRQYQLDRLRYYYAIVECDSAATAKHIYDNCDGAEFEASANFFDLRFVPEGEEFTDEPRETCSSLPELYEPNEFVTDALQHSKVKLTWDNDDPKKAQFAKRAFSKAEIDDMELKAYLASSDSEDGEDASTLKSKWKALLKAGEDSDDEAKPSGDMEITFSAGLSSKVKDSDDDDAGNGVDPENETTIEKYKRKDAEKKQRKRDNKGIVSTAEDKVDLGFDDPFFSEAPSKSKKKEAKPKVDREKEAKEKAELDLLVMDDKEDAGQNHFDMKNILRSEKQAGKKRHRRSKKEEPREGLQDDFEMDVKDPRFAAAFDNENHHFALDPTNSQFKKTKAMSKILEARRDKSKKTDTAVESKSVGREKQKKRKADGMDDLVRSVKARSSKSV